MNRYRLLGDVPEKDRETVKEIIDFEDSLDKSDNINPQEKAKMLVCLAHDWYDVGLEEEGSRLLGKAEKACPRYFEDVILKQTKSDQRFGLIVTQIARELVMLLLHEVNQKREE